jgi:hypothetical protein
MVPRKPPRLPYKKRGSAPYRNYEKKSIEKLLMPNDDPTVFEFPCRFPAAPSIRPESRAQDFDQKRLFGMGRAPKKFLP